MPLAYKIATVLTIIGAVVWLFIAIKTNNKITSGEITKADGMSRILISGFGILVCILIFTQIALAVDPIPGREPWLYNFVSNLFKDLSDGTGIPQLGR